VRELFNFAFINFILSRLPPGLMKDVDAVTTQGGFEVLCCAIAQSVECQKHFRRMMEEAVKEAKHPRFPLNSTRASLMSHLKPGARVEPR